MHVQRPLSGRHGLRYDLGLHPDEADAGIHRGRCGLPGTMPARVMSMAADTLPPDVAAYLTAAARELMEEQQFEPNAERDLRTWLQCERRTICERALEKMHGLIEAVLTRQEVKDAVCEFIGAQVYHRIRDAIPADAARRWQPRFLAYAASQGLTPEAVLKRDGNMTNFICWASSNPSKT
jgi:hypothetical protein